MKATLEGTTPVEGRETRGGGRNSAPVRAQLSTVGAPSRPESNDVRLWSFDLRL